MIMRKTVKARRCLHTRVYSNVIYKTGSNADRWTDAQNVVHTVDIHPINVSHPGNTRPQRKYVIDLCRSNPGGGLISLFCPFSGDYSVQSKVRLRLRKVNRDRRD
mgnify:CR=1 FL=1